MLATRGDHGKPPPVPPRPSKALVAAALARSRLTPVPVTRTILPPGGPQSHDNVTVAQEEGHDINPVLASSEDELCYTLYKCKVVENQSSQRDKLLPNRITGPATCDTAAAQSLSLSVKQSSPHYTQPEPLSLQGVSEAAVEGLNNKSDCSVHQKLNNGVFRHAEQCSSETVQKTTAAITFSREVRQNKARYAPLLPTGQHRHGSSVATPPPQVPDKIPRLEIRHYGERDNFTSSRIAKADDVSSQNTTYCEESLHMSVATNSTKIDRCVQSVANIRDKTIECVSYEFKSLQGNNTQLQNARLGGGEDVLHKVECSSERRDEDVPMFRTFQKPPPPVRHNGDAGVLRRDRALPQVPDKIPRLEIRHYGERDNFTSSRIAKTDNIARHEDSKHSRETVQVPLVEERMPAQIEIHGEDIPRNNGIPDGARNDELEIGQGHNSSPSQNAKFVGEESVFHKVESPARLDGEVPVFRKCPKPPLPVRHNGDSVILRKDLPQPLPVKHEGDAPFKEQAPPPLTKSEVDIVLRNNQTPPLSMTYNEGIRNEQTPPPLPPARLNVDSAMSRKNQTPLVPPKLVEEQLLKKEPSPPLPVRHDRDVLRKEQTPPLSEEQDSMRSEEAPPLPARHDVDVVLRKNQKPLMNHNEDVVLRKEQPPPIPVRCDADGVMLRKTQTPPLSVRHNEDGVILRKTQTPPLSVRHNEDGVMLRKEQAQPATHNSGQENHTSSQSMKHVGSAGLVREDSISSRLGRQNSTGLPESRDTRRSGEDEMPPINVLRSGKSSPKDAPLIEDLVMELRESSRLRCGLGPEGGRIQHSDWFKVDADGQPVRYSSCHITLHDLSSSDTEAATNHLNGSIEKQHRRAMASLQGLPPLPKSLSGINLLEQQQAELTNQRPSAAPAPVPYRPSRAGPSHHGPPLVAPRARKSAGLDAQLAILRKEMFGLRQLDLSLLSQLWSLNESIQEFRQLLQDQEDSAALSPPSPSSAEEGEEFYSPLPRYHAPVGLQLSAVPEQYHLSSSSSQSSIEYGNV